MASFVLCAFLLNSGIAPVPYARAQAVFNLPQPGNRVALSPAVIPPLLKAVKIDPDDPLRFDFILDTGNVPVSDENIKADSTRLIKYFLAALTVPEKDLWVNLSPYEKDRIVPEAFGRTEMGRDLLAEDYLLKQITASLIYPEGETGKTFWKRVYAQAFAKFGTTDIPVDTFNKVWIIPSKAVVYENAGTATAYVAETHLKVMLESDYVAMSHQKDMAESPAPAGDLAKEKSMQLLPSPLWGGNGRGEDVKNILRDVIIPILEKEVNEGKNFIQLRQVFHSLILAAWYKKKIKDSILSQVYADQNKVAGVDIRDPQEASRIYTRYLEAFKTGVYNYIKEEQDPLTREVIPRKYFSGGVIGDMSMMNVVPVPLDFAEEHGNNKLKLTVDMAANLSEIDRGIKKEFIHLQYPVVVNNGLLSENYVGYAMAEKEFVNPDDRPLVGIYGGSGADISTFLPSTNAIRGYLVDQTVVNRERLKNCLQDNVTALSSEYKNKKFKTGYGWSRPSGLADIETYIVMELDAMGVRREDVHILPNEFSQIQGNEFWKKRSPRGYYEPVTIKFPWAYPGQEKKERTITFINADITNPVKYPKSLRDALQEGIDFYYQRASYFIPSDYKRFIPVLLEGMSANGFLLTDEYYLDPDKIGAVKKADDLGEILRAAGLAFIGSEKLESAGMKYFSQRIIQQKMEDGLLDGFGKYGWKMVMMQLEKSDHAAATPKASSMFKKPDTGGIDLTPADRAMQIQNRSGAFKFRIDPARLEQLRNAPGFSPIIINIQPMTDLRFFLGLKDPGKGLAVI